MLSLTSIYIGGIVTLLMAIFHTRFYRLFKWKAEFRRISDMNKRIFYTIHLALLLLFLIIGLLTLIYAKELSECIGICFGFNLLISVFWVWRTVWQIFYFRGEIMHYVLIVSFSLLCIAYLIPVIMNLT